MDGFVSSAEGRNGAVTVQDWTGSRKCGGRGMKGTHIPGVLVQQQNI